MHLEENVPLAPFTTLRIGGPARYLAHITSEADLLDAIRFAREQNLPIFTIGGGSNLIVPDEGYPGLILQIAIEGPIHIDGPKDEFPPNRFTTYLVPAGYDWDSLVKTVCEAGLSGVECLAGIPGFVGGSPIQNIGAYGQEVSQTISQVRALDLESLHFVMIPANECGFAYRTSIFNRTARGRYIVTAVQFRFDLDANPNLTYAELEKQFSGSPHPKPLQVYEAIRRIRATKGMLIDPANPTPDTRSAGSFFKNPIVPAKKLAHIAQVLGIPEAEIPHWPAGPERVKLPAAWLIERAGFPKGFTQSPGSPVGISSRHTLALINKSGTATCRDLQQLASLITIQVEYHLNISLEQEPVTLA
jgi:UDP-N-acetylmuramate dehydrogenase